MIKKILIFSLALIILMNFASAIDSSNWTTASVGYEEFRIPPEFENPYRATSTCMRQTRTSTNSP